MVENESPQYQETTTRERLTWGAVGAAVSVSLTFLLNNSEPVQQKLTHLPAGLPWVEYPAIALGFFILGGALTAERRRKTSQQDLRRTGPLR